MGLGPRPDSKVSGPSLWVPWETLQPLLGGGEYTREEARRER